MAKNLTEKERRNKEFTNAFFCEMYTDANTGAEITMLYFVDNERCYIKFYRGGRMYERAKFLKSLIQFNEKNASMKELCEFYDIIDDTITCFDYIAKDFHNLLKLWDNLPKDNLKI